MSDSTAMYLVANRGLGMSGGKLAAQIAHAAVEAFRGSDPDIIDKWLEGGHYAKLVMQARNEEHLKTIQEYLEKRGFKCFPIIDEGRTEIAPLQYTALGVEIVDRSIEHVVKTFSALELYRDPIKVTLEIDR